MKAQRFGSVILAKNPVTTEEVTLLVEASKPIGLQPMIMITGIGGHYAKYEEAARVVDDMLMRRELPACIIIDLDGAEKLNAPLTEAIAVMKEAA